MVFILFWQGSHLLEIVSADQMAFVTELAAGE